MKQRRWTFGPAELLPLLGAMQDFGDLPRLPTALFELHHVVRSVEGCGAREASQLLHQASRIWRGLLLQQGTQVLLLPRGKGAKTRVWRLPEGSPAQQGAVLARYASGHPPPTGGRQQQLEEKEEVHLSPGAFNAVHWEPEPPPHFLDIAYLTAEPAPRDRLRAASDVAKLRREALEGKGGAVRSAAEIATALETGKKTKRPQASLRLQAEGGAHVFLDGSTTPLVMVDTAQALLMRLLRRYTASREDHLAMLRGPLEYPGVVQVRWQRRDQSGLLPLRAEGWAPPAGWGEVRDLPRARKEALLAQSFDLPGDDASAHQRLRSLAAGDESSGGGGRKARIILAALADDAALLRELQLLQLAAWCRSAGVTHLVAHPRDGERYESV